MKNQPFLFQIAASLTNVCDIMLTSLRPSVQKKKKKNKRIILMNNQHFYLLKDMLVCAHLFTGNLPGVFEWNYMYVQNYNH